MHYLRPRVENDGALKEPEKLKTEKDLDKYKPFFI
jgi:hypothetical protein